MRESRLAAPVNVAAGVGMLAASAVVIWSTLTPRLGSVSAVTEPLRFEGQVVQLAEAPTEGALTAPVGMIILSDFECPYCARFATDQLAALRKTYVASSQMLVAFKHFPLTTIHRYARLAAHSAECSRREGQFWTMHDWLFAHPDRITADEIRRAAGRFGLGASWAACFDNDEDAVVDADMVLASSLGVQSTPTILIGRLDGKSVTLRGGIQGSRPLSEYESIIRDVLRRP